MVKWIRLAGALGLAACVAAAVHAADGPTVFGKRLLQANDVPSDVLARFAEHDAKTRAKGQKPGFMTSGGEDWAAPELTAPSAGNPYRIVIRVAGTALADGDARSVWMAGWSENGQFRMFPVTGTTRPGAKAGERIELVGASGPVSFKEDRTRAPAVNFLGTENLRIDDVKVEVWSGVGKATFPELVRAWSPLLGGIVFLGLAIWWRKR